LQLKIYHIHNLSYIKTFL